MMKKILALVLTIILMVATSSAVYGSEADSQLLEKYRSLINALEQRDFSIARTELERYIRENASEYHSVEITSENWSEYFDVTIVDHYDVDAFGNPVYFTVKGQIKLKDEYHSRLVQNTANEVRFNVRYVDQPITVIADFQNKNYNITRKESSPFEKSCEVRTHILETPYNGKALAGFFQSSGMSYRDNDGNILYYVDHFLEYEVLQAIGTIWLYNE